MTKRSVSRTFLPSPSEAVPAAPTGAASFSSRNTARSGLGPTARTSLRALRPGGHLVWFGLVTVLSGGRRDWVGTAKMAAILALAFLGNLRPGGKRTSLYSIQWLARRHPDWFRSNMPLCLTNPGGAFWMERIG